MWQSPEIVTSAPPTESQIVHCGIVDIVAATRAAVTFRTGLSETVLQSETPANAKGIAAASRTRWVRIGDLHHPRAPGDVAGGSRPVPACVRAATAAVPSTRD